MTASSPSSPNEPAHSGTGLYVFCVTRATTPALDGPGLTADTTLTRVVQGELAAVLCQVDLREWTGPEAETRLRDLDWLGPRAVRHEAVIEQVMADAPVLPLRFGSLFSSAASVRAWLRAGTSEIDRFLHAGAALEEWSLKGWLDVPRAEAARLNADPRLKALPASPGVRYLLEQKLRQDITKSVRAWARSIEQQLLVELRELVARTRSLRALSGDVSGRTEEVMFHQALLVPRAVRDELAARVTTLSTELSAQGLALELTGPWPLYSFVPPLASAAEVAADSGDDATHDPQQDQLSTENPDD